MKTRKMMLQTLGAIALAVMVSVGCQEIVPFEINSPEDLQEKIDAYKAEQEKDAPVIDGEELTVDPQTVGSTDDQSGWWAEFSQYFTIPSGKRLLAIFKNYSLGEGNYQNWVLCVSTVAERGAAGYAEYFVLRSDRWGWTPSGDITSGIVTTIDGMEEADYTGGDFWTDFRSKMNGATVTISVDNASEGYCVVEANSVATDGSVIKETYTQKTKETASINAFFVVDHSHIVFSSAWLMNSQVPEVPDYDAESITLTGFPEQIECGATLESVLEASNLQGQVVFADGTAAEVNIEDVNFTVNADFAQKAGKDVIAYSYSKTKKGKYGQSATGFTMVDVINPIVSIAVTKQPVSTTYYFYENTALAFRNYGMEVTGTMADGSTTLIPLTALTYSPIEVKEGAQDVTISYVGSSATLTTTQAIQLVKGAYAVGAPDNTSGFFSAFTPDKNVPAGQSVSFEMEVYGGASQWNAPVAVLRKTDLTLGAAGEYAVTRLDNYGWGGGFVNADENKETTWGDVAWDWALISSMINGSHMRITATNNGDGTAQIVYDITWPDGRVHRQVYKNIAVDSADVMLGITVDGCYLVIVE